MPKKLALSLVGLAVLVPSVNAAPFQVLAKDNFFKPTLVEIKKDRKVTWVWKGTNLHNVAIRKPGTTRVIKRSALKDSGEFSYRFTRTGTYSVICEIHERMKMKVVVRR